MCSCVGSSSVHDLVLAGDVLHAGDLSCLSCAVKHCHKAVWYILSCSDCLANRLLFPAVVPKSSSFASLLVADACLNLQQADSNCLFQIKPCIQLWHSTFMSPSMLIQQCLPHATMQQCSFSTCNVGYSNVDHDTQKEMYLVPKQVQQPVHSSAFATLTSLPAHCP